MYVSSTNIKRIMAILIISEGASAILDLKKIQRSKFRTPAEKCSLDLSTTIQIERKSVLTFHLFSTFDQKLLQTITNCAMRSKNVTRPEVNIYKEYR